MFMVLFACCRFACPAQTNLYLFPGTGSDGRIFSGIAWPAGFVPRHIHYPMPAKGATMRDYALLLAAQIDTSQPFVLVGVSVGGMLCTELADTLRPEKTILLSSAKCWRELPRHYRFQRALPLHKLFGGRAIKALSPLAQAVVEPDRNSHKATFRSMLKSKDRLYLKRTVDMIINWPRTGFPSGIVHIHGTNDHTLPLRNISPTIIVQGGSHMMTLTRGGEISKLLNEIMAPN